MPQRRRNWVGSWLAILGLSMGLGGCASMPQAHRVHVSDDGKVEVYVRTRLARDGSLQERRVELIAQPDAGDRCERVVTETTAYAPDGGKASRTVEKRACRITESRTVERWDIDGKQVAWEVAVDVDHDGRFDFHEELPGPGAPLELAQARAGVAPDL